MHDAEQAYAGHAVFVKKLSRILAFEGVDHALHCI